MKIYLDGGSLKDIKKYAKKKTCAWFYNQSKFNEKI